MMKCDLSLPGLEKFLSHSSQVWQPPGLRPEDSGEGGSSGSGESRENWENSSS